MGHVRFFKNKTIDKYAIMCPICLMKRGSTSDRIERLEDIAARLKGGSYFTVHEIADDLGVSVRTISRDIQILRDQGLPIDADRGRGGGLRLDAHWGIGRVHFSYAEAVDLLISLAIAQQMKSPMFMAHLEPIIRKLMASFSPSMKHKVKSLKSRILIGESASVFTLSAFSNPSGKIVEKLHQGFMMMQRMEITYRTENGRVTRREIEPHYLLLTYPIWYVLAWDHLRGDVRMFRFDRIKRASAIDQTFKLLTLREFEPVLRGVAVL